MSVGGGPLQDFFTSSPLGSFSFGVEVERRDEGTKEAEGIRWHKMLPGGEKQVPLSVFSLILLELLCLMWLLGMWWSLRFPATCLGFLGP